MNYRLFLIFPAALAIGLTGCGKEPEPKVVDKTKENLAKTLALYDDALNKIKKSENERNHEDPVEGLERRYREIEMESKANLAKIKREDEHRIYLAKLAKLKQRDDLRNVETKVAVGQITRDEGNRERIRILAD